MRLPLAGTSHAVARRLLELDAIGVERRYVTTASSEPERLLRRLLAAHRLAAGAAAPSRGADEGVAGVGSE